MILSTFHVSFNETRGLSGPLMGWLPRCKIFGHKNVSLCWGATSRHLLCLHAPWQLSATGSSQAPGLFAAARRAQLAKRNLIPGTALRATSGRPTLQPPSLLGAAPSLYPGSGRRRNRAAGGKADPPSRSERSVPPSVSVRLVSCSPRISSFTEKRKKPQ